MRPGGDGGVHSAGAGADIGWAALAFLFAGLAAVLVLVAALPRASGERVPTHRVSGDPGPQSTARLEEGTQLAREWSDRIAELCSHPKLEAEGMAPDCATGTIVFGDAFFEGAGSSQLREEGMRKLQTALPLLLASLRSSELVWQNLEAIELRGHADPRADKDPYVSNLVSSRQRPLGVALYLVSEWALEAKDREDLKRLLIVSAASHSRPPASCPDATRECFPFWRRVEIIPVLRETPLRDELLRLRADLDPRLSERQP